MCTLNVRFEVLVEVLLDCEVVRIVKGSKKERVYINKRDVGRSGRYVTHADHMMGSKPGTGKGGG